MQRSRKYMAMTDEKILELFANGVQEKDQYYLDKEIELRNLEEKAMSMRKARIKAGRDPLPWKKIAFFAAVAAMFFYRMIKQFGIRF